MTRALAVDHPDIIQPGLRYICCVAVVPSVALASQTVVLSKLLLSAAEVAGKSVVCRTVTASLLVLLGVQGPSLHVVVVVTSAVVVFVVVAAVITVVVAAVVVVGDVTRSSLASVVCMETPITF